MRVVDYSMQPVIAETRLQFLLHCAGGTHPDGNIPAVEEAAGNIAGGPGASAEPREKENHGLETEPRIAHGFRSKAFP